MDLLKPVVDESEWHPHFRHLLKDRVYCHSVIQEWADGFPDRDNKFVKEFQKTYNPCIWELYLNQLFKEIGLNFNWGYNRPDFLVKNGDIEISVEAVVSNHSQRDEPEWNQIGDLSDLPDPFEFERREVLRFSNSIHSKYRKYQESYSKLSHVRGKPFVVALSPYVQPYSWLGYGRSLKSLLYDRYEVVTSQTEAFSARMVLGRIVDCFPCLAREPGVSFLRNWLKSGSAELALSTGSFRNDNGSDIRLGIFNDSSMKEVSAVLYNNTAAQGKIDALSPREVGLSHSYVFEKRLPGGSQTIRHCSSREYGETIFDGLQIFHNPFAENPLPRDFFPLPGVAQHFYVDGKYNTEFSEEFLLWRYSVINAPPTTKEEMTQKMKEYFRNFFFARFERMCKCLT